MSRYIATATFVFVAMLGCDHEGVASLTERSYTAPDKPPVFDPEIVGDAALDCLESGEDVCEFDHTNNAGGEEQCTSEVGNKEEGDGVTKVEVTICCGLVCDVFACEWKTGDPSTVSCAPTTCD